MRWPARVGLVRHRRRPATAALGDLADLGAGQVSSVRGDLPERPGREGEASGQVGDRGAQRVPGLTRAPRRPSSRAYAVGSSTGSVAPYAPGKASKVPACAAELGGQRIAYGGDPVPRVEDER